MLRQIRRETHASYQAAMICGKSFSCEAELAGTEVADSGRSAHSEGEPSSI